jgi:hypothetical protein
MVALVTLANFSGHGRAIVFLIVASLIVLLALAACFIENSSSKSDK